MGTHYSTEELRSRLGTVTIVEALGAPYYHSGHIPGALNMPPHRTSELVASLLPDKDAAIVVYGAHRRSHEADTVARQLRTLGYRNVSRYAEGKEGWVQAGLPFADGDDGDP